LLALFGDTPLQAVTTATHANAVTPSRIAVTITYLQHNRIRTPSRRNR
jgi:hypothetical protein